MTIFASIKRMLRLLLPPILIEGTRSVWYTFRQPLLEHVPNRQPLLEYAPDGWQTFEINSQITGWSVESVVDAERTKWEAFCRNLQGSGALGFSHEYTDLSVVRNVSFHNIHLTYAYVLALGAHQKSMLSVLDWGGGLGHYYLIGQALLPDVTLDFHCKEVPLIAEAGKQLNPNVHWYVDESCLERAYDLVMINGSLQYIEDWADTLRRIAPAVKSYLFLTRLPVVDHGPGFVAIQRVYGAEMLHQQLNQAAVLQVVEETGLHLMREFVVGDRLYIKNAPEPFELRGWLFKRM